MASDTPFEDTLPGAASAYPHVWWEETEATFLPWGCSLPEGRTTAVVVFAFSLYFSADLLPKRLSDRSDGPASLSGAEPRIVAADIVGRGWCLPSGRLEPGETAEQAAHREAWEEAGLTLNALRQLGTFALKSGQEAVLVPAYLAEGVTRVPDPPCAAESRSTRLMAREEVATLYYRWDPLLAAVFDLAFAESGLLFSSPLPKQEREKIP